MAKQKAGAKKVLAHVRRQKAMDMRVRGKTYQQIAATLGITKQAAHKTISVALRESGARLERDLDAVRAMELNRIYILQERILSQLPEVTKTEDIQRLGTVLLKAGQRESELLGVTITKRVEVSAGEMSDTELMAEFERIREKLDSEAADDGSDDS